MYFKDLEDTVHYIINLGSTDYIQPNYTDNLLPLLGIKDETKIVMSVIKDYRKLASKLAKVVAKQADTIGSLHAEALELIYKDCSKNNDCALPAWLA